MAHLTDLFGFRLRPMGEQASPGSHPRLRVSAPYSSSEDDSLDITSPRQLIRKLSKVTLEEDDRSDWKEESGLTHECGVFGCIATGDWPSQIDVGQVICLGLVALQHR